jgi:hypothetical protein
MMPITIEVNHERREVRTIAEGPITMEEIESHLNSETDHRALGYPELIDARLATAKFNTDDARETVYLLRRLGEKGSLGPSAVIVADEVTYGMMRMLEILLDDVCELRPFRQSERAKADKWLAEASERWKNKGAP